MELTEHFFREEAGRLVPALTRLFGLHNLALAEDVAQDALCQALEVWKHRGIPADPRAWLLTAAKHRAIDILRRERKRLAFAPDLAFLLESEWTLAPAVAERFGPDALRDDQLRMMFSCCHPKLSEDARVALVLHLLCGFGVGEIAAAFLSGRAAIEKRLTRAKRVLARSKSLFDLRQDDVMPRLESVHRALYLLFSEGYHGAHPETSVRRDLCVEALRLVSLLGQDPIAATPATDALAALMCFHASRLPGRLDAGGELTSLTEQDRSRWDRDLIAEGHRLLERAWDRAEPQARGPFHFEAAIAGAHASARTAEATPWPAIVALYDGLMHLRPSPVVALNRAVAIAQADGPEKGLAAIEAIADRDALKGYPFYAATLAELELRRGQTRAAQAHFQDALRLARNPMEKSFLEKRAALAAQR